MEQLLLINPKARSKRKMAKRTRRTRSAAQRAATRRLVAMNRGRRANPARRRRHHVRRARRSNPIHLTSRHVRRHRRVHRRRNPIGMGGMGALFMTALKGGVGAVAVDMIYGYLPLPVTMKTGNMGAVSKAAVAVLLGTLGRRVLGRTATDMAAGALTVQAYQIIGSLTSGMGLGYVSAGLPVSASPASTSAPAPAAGMGAYLPRGTGNTALRSVAGSRSFAPGFGEYIR